MREVLTIRGRPYPPDPPNPPNPKKLNSWIQPKRNDHGIPEESSAGEAISAAQLLRTRNTEDS
jgi:hypothetical protein